MYCCMYVGTFVPQYPVPDRGMVQAAEGEVPVLITQTRACAWKEKGAHLGMQAQSSRPRNYS